jgi:hypothetical protein
MPALATDCAAAWRHYCPGLTHRLDWMRSFENSKLIEHLLLTERELQQERILAHDFFTGLIVASSG